MNVEQGISTAILKSKPALADRFEVIEVLGEGASGAVYRVSDRQQGGKQVALKILLNNSAFDENTLTRFVAELRILQKVHHQNLVEAYDLIELGETIAFTMEYVPGSDLGEIFRSRRLAHEEVDSIFYQILSALGELHRNGIVHRDIKLENVLVTGDGRVKLSDLGLMKCGEFDSMTKTGVLLGTAQYMPPEYVRGSVYDHRGDLYAVGLMLYELLTSKRRLSDKNGNEALEYLIKTRFQIPRITLTGLPRKYLDIIDRALDPDPDNRFQSADEMRDAFVKAPEVVLTKSGSHRIEPELKRFCEISAMSEALNRNSVSRPSFYRHALLGILFLCLATGVPYFWSVMNSQVTLTGGEYEGTINVSGSLRKVGLAVSSEGVGFTSGIEGCAKAAVDLESGKILCDRSGLQLRIDGQDGQIIRGSIIDIEARERFKFTVSRLTKSAPASVAVEEKAPARKSIK